jgi:ABC-type glutathione transport system ATPase component
VAALSGASLTVDDGEVVGLLGESGCGKSTLLSAVLGLLPPSARIEKGSLRFQGEDLRSLGEAAWRRLRGARIAIVFQDPTLALNPVRRIGAQVMDVIRAHETVAPAEAAARAGAALEEVGLADVGRALASYPHELSGGERQRVCIAQALVCRPALLLADEPTASLDAVTAAGIRALLLALQQRRRLSVLVASHDLGALAALASRVWVMEKGRIVDSGAPAEVFGLSSHPYTRALVESVPPRPAAVWTGHGG